MSRQRGQGADSEAGLRTQPAGRRSEGERAESWQQERARVLSQTRVVVVKVGSAVLTDASGHNSQVLEGLAAQLAFLRDLPLTGEDAASAGQPEPAPHASDASAPAQGARRIVLVSSGAVAAGRAALASGQPSATGIGSCSTAGAGGVIGCTKGLNVVQGAKTIIEGVKTATEPTDD